MIHRCCVCRAHGNDVDLEPSTLPGHGRRCRDRVGCKRRVRAQIDAHTSLAEICNE